MRYGWLVLTLMLALQPLARGDARWGLDFKVEKVGTALVKGAQGWGNYLYLVATVSNPSGQEVPLSLGMDVTTDVVGRQYRGGYDPSVAKAVQKSTGMESKSFYETRGAFADGASVQFLVSFGKLDPNVDALTIHVDGLRDRVYRDQYQWWVEDTSLQIDCERTGDEFQRQNDLVRFRTSRWHSEPRTPLKRNSPK